MFAHKKMLFKTFEWLQFHDIFSIRDHPFKTLANFHKFLTPTPLPSAVFSTIRRQIWQIFDPSPPKTCRRLKWMVPKSLLS